MNHADSEKIIKPRFSWPVRCFLICFIGQMLVQSLICLAPTDDWSKELKLDCDPLALPTERELARCDEGTHPDDYQSRSERWNASFKSLARYFVPYPEKKVRDNIENANDAGKFALTWIHSRLKFIGRIYGVDQEFPMFSPNVGTDDTIARLRLVYADGTTDAFRLNNDPADISKFSRWSGKKLLQVHSSVHDDVDCRLGVCKQIAQSSRNTNAEGSELVKIEVYKVFYVFPGPWENATEFIANQAGPPAENIEDPFWEYDVKTGKGRYLE